MPQQILLYLIISSLHSTSSSFSPGLTLLVRHVAIPGRRARKFCPALRAIALGGCTALLALVSQQVAEGAELAPVAAVIPALRLRARGDDAHALFGTRRVRETPVGAHSRRSVHRVCTAADVGGRDADGGKSRDSVAGKVGVSHRVEENVSGGRGGAYGGYMACGDSEAP